MSSIGAYLTAASDRAGAPLPPASSQRPIPCCDVRRSPWVHSVAILQGHSAACLTGDDPACPRRMRLEDLRGAVEVKRAEKDGGVK